MILNKYETPIPRLNCCKNNPKKPELLNLKGQNRSTIGNSVKVL